MQALARRYNRRDGLSVAPMLEAVQSFTSDNVALVGAGSDQIHDDTASDATSDDDKDDDTWSDTSKLERTRASRIANES
jgi:hypothetical protein